MNLCIQEATNEQIDLLVSLLRDADEDEGRMRAILSESTSYLAREGERFVGAVTVHWREEESEIEYISVIPELRGKGYGKAILESVLVEARVRGVPSLLVGTANGSLENIAFYQKCGFRIDGVRRDFFAYIQPPVSEHGIPTRDMLMFRYTFYQ